MLKKQISILILCCIFSLQILAADNVYTLFSVGYSDVDFIQDSNKGFGYKMAIGYQFDPQWYVEVGYQSLIHDNLYLTELPSAKDVMHSKNVWQGDALFLAFLGKSFSQAGELFYRVGVLKTDIRGQQLLPGVSECKLGKTYVLAIANYGAATMCDYDESGIAGVIGFGFDYFIGARTMLRTEVEYIKGQDNLTVTTVNLGLRYNF